MEWGVHCAALAQSTCLKCLLDNCTEPAYYSRQKVPQYCPSTFASGEALEGVARDVPSVSVQILKYIKTMPTMRTAYRQCHIQLLFPHTSIHPQSSKKNSEFVEEITHQFHQEKVQAGMKMELQFLHVRTLALPFHNSQEHVFLQNNKGTERARTEISEVV